MAANLGHQARNVSAVRHRAYPGLEPRETKHPPGLEFGELCYRYQFSGVSGRPSGHCA
jgi:hypothetical protein